MEEQEKIDMREHLIGWIDTFLKDGIIPSVVNPKAIKANYILKSKIKDKIEEIQNRNYNDYTREQDGNEVKYSILNEFKELLEEGD